MDFRGEISHFLGGEAHSGNKLVLSSSVMVTDCLFSSHMVITALHSSSSFSQLIVDISKLTRPIELN